MYQYAFYFFVIFLGLMGCQNATPPTSNTTTKTTSVALSPTFQITFLDSLDASQFIIKDDTEHFFEHLSAVDIAIQTKQNYPANTSREQQLINYKKYLQQDVASFSKTETDFVYRAFMLAIERLKALKVNDILPHNIDLVKTTAQHYGKSAYYTRENGIVIPDDVLQSADLASFTDVMLHEIFHIYSRNHPTKQLALYQLIGFRPIKNITFPDSLQQRLLLNPDGINPRYGIDLKQGDTVLTALPLIVSNESQYQPNKQQFFDYLSFDLYPLQRQADSSFIVLTKNGYRSPIHFADFPDFFQQIRDNTDYIIHPDEVLADNFVLVVNQLNEIKEKIDLSKDGRKLLKTMQYILEN